MSQYKQTVTGTRSADGLTVKVSVEVTGEKETAAKEHREVVAEVVAAVGTPKNFGRNFTTMIGEVETFED